MSYEKLTKVLGSSILILFSLWMIAFAEEIVINGAGASFPFPLYSQWAYKYEKIEGMKLNYQSIGSGGGIAQIKAKTVDFGASDAPLEIGELDEAGLWQFPMIIGGVVCVVNLKNIKAGELRLSPDTLVDIFLGKIKSWDDNKIKKDNPQIKLPKKEITVVHRADGSGTTWIFTNYLSKISEEWNKNVGCGKSVNWPVGIGGKGNEGISAYVQKLEGAIGYVEYAYALENKLAYIQLKNRAGKYVMPTIESFQTAADNADWANAKGFYMILTDQPGENSWPITGASYILIHKNPENPAKTKAMLKFFHWCFYHGPGIARELHYVPLPENVVKLVEESWKREIKGQLWP